MVLPLQAKMHLSCNPGYNCCKVDLGRLYRAAILYGVRRLRQSIVRHRLGRPQPVRQVARKKSGARSRALHKRNIQTLRGVPFVEGAFVERGAVDPFVAIFAQEAVAAHEEALEEAVLVDGLEHILRAGGAEVAAGSVDRRDDFLVEADDVLDGPNHWSGGRLG